MARVASEIGEAEKAGKLSNPVAYEEARQQLPYTGACIKESLYLNPPAPNLFARVVPAPGKVIDGVQVPAGTEVTTVSYIVQQDPQLYGLYAEDYRPKRWLEADADKASEMEAVQFTFGNGARVAWARIWQ